MAGKNKNISYSEWKVMKALWDEPGLTLREIDERVKDAGWSYTTVRTLVTRLSEKGAIEADKSNPGNFRYSPVLSESECTMSETRSFIERVFDGKKSKLVASLTKDSGLTEEETKTLMALLEKIDN